MPSAELASSSALVLKFREESFRKRLEHAVNGVFRGCRDISCQPPRRYGERFLSFADDYSTAQPPTDASLDELRRLAMAAGHVVEMRVDRPYTAEAVRPVLAQRCVERRCCSASHTVGSMVTIATLEAQGCREEFCCASKHQGRQEKGPSSRS